MVEVNKRLKELENYQNRIVASIKELNTNNKKLRDRIDKLEVENAKLRKIVTYSNLVSTIFLYAK